MKKLMSALMMVMFLAATPFMASANASDVLNSVVQDEVTWTEIESEKVPEAVSKAAEKDNPGATVQKVKVAFIEGETVYKVIQKDATGEEKVTKYKSDGNKYKSKKK